MKIKHLLTKTLLVAAGLLLGGANPVWGETLIFTEDFADETYNVSWGGTSAGGISPSVVEGALKVANGSSSGDRSAYIAFGTNAYTGCCRLTFDVAMTKSNWSGKNNYLHVLPSATTDRYPSTTDAALTITQESNGAITIAGESVGTYDGVSLTYDLFLNTTTGNAKVIVKNGATTIKTISYATTATGINTINLQFNKNNGAFAIDNISFYSLVAPAFTLSEASKAVSVGNSETVNVTDITGSISVSSDNTAIATASYNEGVVTINGVANGAAIITVTGTNDGLTLEKTIDVTVGSVSRTDVTVNYLDESSNPIASQLVLSDVVVGSTLTAAEVVYESVLYGVGCRYVNPVLSESLPYTVVENGVINITYTTQAAVSSITVNYKYSDATVYSEVQSAIDNLYVGDSYNVPFRMYVMNGGVLYQTANRASDPYYGEPTTLTANVVIDKAVTPVDLGGGTVVFFKDFDGSTGNNAGVRASYTSAYDNTQFTSEEDLPAGKYTFIVRAYSRGRGSLVKVGDQQVFTIADVGGSWQDKTFTDVNVPAAGKLALVKGASSTDPVDIIIAILHSVPAAIPSSGLATISSAYPLDFANATDESSAKTLKAYVVSNLSATSATLTEVTEAPANTGIILMGTASETYTIPVLATASSVGTNKLHASVTPTLLADGSFYVLKNGKFLLVTGTADDAARTVPACKAYLLASDMPAPAPELTINFGGEATGINTLNVENGTLNGKVFDLQGRQVAQPAKGLYIVNGKKVVIK